MVCHLTLLLSETPPAFRAFLYRGTARDTPRSPPPARLALGLERLPVPHRSNLAAGATSIIGYASSKIGANSP
jgi:hypothetical protein